MRPCDLAWQAFQHGVAAPFSALELSSMEGTSRLQVAFQKWWKEHRELGKDHDGSCEMCGHDPEAVVSLRWEFAIDRDPPSLNDRLFNSGARAHLYRRERDMWCWEFRAMRLKHSIPKANARRRVTLTRYYGSRQKERDRDNLIGGMKTVVDAMTIEGLIVDDGSAHVELHYRQERVAVGKRLGIIIEELG